VAPAKFVKRAKENPEAMSPEDLDKFKMPYSEFAGRMRATLESGAPPAGESSGGLDVVPLSVAPLAEPRRP